jgi:hypothetical protein
MVIIEIGKEIEKTIGIDLYSGPASPASRTGKAKYRVLHKNNCGNHMYG